MSDEKVIEAAPIQAEWTPSVWELSESRTTLKYPDEWFQEYLGGGSKSVAGMIVSPKTAMGLSAFFDGMRIIAEDVAGLPIRISSDNGYRKKYFPNHSLFKLLNVNPNDDATAFSFWETIVAHAVVWGHGFAEIVRDGAGRVIFMHPLNPNDVTLLLKNDTQSIVYKVQVSNQEAVILQEYEVFHLKGIGFHQSDAYSLTHLARESIGNGLACQQFAGSYFANGAIMSGVVSYPQKLNKPALDNLREQMSRRYSGAVNAHKVFVGESGMTYTPIQMNAEESQMLESIKFTVDDIARWLRLPPHKLGSMDRATFSNIEEQNIDYIASTLRPWTERLRQEIKRKLFLPQEQSLAVSYFFLSFHKGNAAARTAYYTAMAGVAALSPNEIRYMEDLEPQEDGDEYFLSTGFQPLKKVLAPPPPPVVPLLPPPADGDPNDKDKTQQSEVVDSEKTFNAIKQGYSKILADAIRRVLVVEQDRIQKASKRAKFEGFVEQFYQETPVCMRPAVYPIVDAISNLVSIDIESGVKSIIENHIKRSKSELNDAKKLNGWLGDRPEQFAKEQIDLLMKGK